MADRFDYKVTLKLGDEPFAHAKLDKLWSDGEFKFDAGITTAEFQAADRAGVARVTVLIERVKAEAK